MHHILKESESFMSDISREPRCPWKLSFFKYYISPSCWKRLVDGDPKIVHVCFGYYHKVWDKNTNQQTFLTCLFELRNIKGSFQLLVKPEVKSEAPESWSKCMNQYKPWGFSSVKSWEWSENPQRKWDALRERL